jgi:hypothetical protein
MGSLGFLQRLRRKAASALRRQPDPRFLRTHPLQNVADVSLTEELLAEAALGEGVARRLLGDLAYRSEELRETLAEMGIVLATERSERRRRVRQRVEIALSSLKRVFGVGETLATTLVGLATRIAAKMTAYTHAFLVNRVLGRPQGKSRISGHKPDNTHLVCAECRLWKPPSGKVVRHRLNRGGNRDARAVRCT